MQIVPAVAGWRLRFRPGFGLTCVWGAEDAWPTDTLAKLGALAGREPDVITDDAGKPVARWMWTAAEVVDAGGPKALRLVVTTGTGDAVRVIGDGWLDPASAGTGDPTVWLSQTRYIMGPAGSGSPAVQSVQGKTGVVTLAPSDIGAATAAQGTKADSAVQPAALTPLVTMTDPRLTDARTPLAHTHALADLTQSGATSGQVPQWSGTAWTPTTPAAGGGTTHRMIGPQIVWPSGPSVNGAGGIFNTVGLCFPMEVKRAFAWTALAVKSNSSPGTTLRIGFYTYTGTALNLLSQFGPFPATAGLQTLNQPGSLAQSSSTWVVTQVQGSGGADFAGAAWGDSAPLGSWADAGGQPFVWLSPSSNPLPDVLTGFAASGVSLSPAVLITFTGVTYP